ncbi:Ig-like domain-containing protein [Mycobacterium sp. RTGN5]|uniref:Ig-like domain-containing protein n=1 Tax=Mycobacterium sp. RTGN5 TaxID=3016522 RepID=UPI0029C6E4F5|nr:Ig-like domain-containing protein [Mycobacterium sp. RTGN5]
MAAVSPRKPRRTQGRHRKPSKFETSNCAHWLGVGAVGVGLAAAVAGGQGTASASTDGSSNAGSANNSPSAGPARAASQNHQRTAPGNAQGNAGSKRSPVSTATATATATTPRPRPRSGAAAALVTSTSQPVTAVRTVVLTPAPAADPVANAISLMQHNLSEMGTAVLRNGARAGDELRAEIGRITGELNKILPAPSSAAAQPTVAQPTVASRTASASETPVEKALDTLQIVLNQLVGWPEPPTFKFVTPANYLLDQALDAHDLTIDLNFANPTPSFRWAPDLMRIVHLFIQPIDPDYTFAIGLNVLGSLLNRIVPPFTIKDPQSATLTKTQVAAAAVGAMVKVMDELLAGDFNPEHWRDAAVAGGTAGITNPSSVLNMTFTTGAQPNLFSLMAYIAVVAVYDRFRWVALDHLPMVASSTQTGQLLTIVSGKVTATDADGDPLIYTSTQAAKGIVTVLPDGSWTYTRTSDLASSDTDSFTITIDDSLGQIGQGGLDHPYAPDGHTVTVVVNVSYTGTLNVAPVAVGSAGLPDGMGVVRGTVTAVDFNGDSLTYSLVNPGTTGATSSSIYTTEGGIVALNTATGAFVYIPKVSTDLLPALDTDTFQVQVADGNGGTATASVVVLSNLSPGTTTTSTSAYTENGKVNVPGDDSGLLTYSLGAGPSKGSVVINADGTYTYTRSVSSTGSTSDTFTIIGTDTSGKTVTLPTVSVSPPLITVTPTTTVTGGTFIPPTKLLGVVTVPGTQTTTGTFSGVDASSQPVTVASGIYTSALGGTITVAAGGGFLYSHTALDDEWHKAAALDAPATDKADTVKINVTDSMGGVSQVTFSVPLATENAAPSSSASVGSADGLGVVRGSVSGSDSDGDSFTYSLAGAGNPGGATSASTYTSKGGIVALNPDGSFTYIPNASASTSDSFKVLVSDGHGGTTTATVNVSLSTPSPLANVNTSTHGTVTGNLNIPAADSALMTYSLGAGPSKGSVTVNPDGSFSYTRTSGLNHTTTPNDSFTVIGTEVATGKTVTIATINVVPTVDNAVPAAGIVTVASSSLTSAATRKQTTTGTIGASDADGDALTFTAGTLSTVNGGSVTVAADGSFTYTISKSLVSSYYHDAAKIGALGNAVGDNFIVTVSDGFGGSTTFTAVVPIYATNTAPSLTDGIRWPGSTMFGSSTTWTTVFGSDIDDGDSVSYAITQQPANGIASYDSGSQILSTTGTETGDTIVLTVYDGYYVVNNGVVSTTPSSISKTYTAQQNA